MCPKVWASSPHLLVGSLLWLTMLGVAASAWGPREVVASDRAVITDTRSVDDTGVDAGHASSVVSGHAAALALPSASMGVELPVSTLFTVQRVVADYVALTAW